MAEAKAEVMEEIEDNREEGEEDDAMELTVVLNLLLLSFTLRPFIYFSVIVCFQKERGRPAGLVAVRLLGCEITCDFYLQGQ